MELDFASLLIWPAAWLLVMGVVTGATSFRSRRRGRADDRAARSVRVRRLDARLP